MGYSAVTLQKYKKFCCKRHKTNSKVHCQVKHSMMAYDKLTIARGAHDEVTLCLRKTSCSSGGTRWKTTWQRTWLMNQKKKLICKEGRKTKVETLSLIQKKQMKRKATKTSWRAKDDRDDTSCS